MTRNVLIIDDEPNMRWVLGKALEQAGYSVSAAASGDEGLAVLARDPIELVLLDLKLKGEDGIMVLRRLRERRPDVVVMMLTAYGTVPNAVEAMQLGAIDFLRKPFDVEELVFKIARALERQALQQQVARLTLAQNRDAAFSALLGSAPAWQRAIAHATHIAALDLNVLLVGEIGSDRGSIARAIHTASTRRESPLVEADLAVYTVSEDVLFGIDTDDGLWGSAGNGTIIVRGLTSHPEIVQTVAERMANTAVSPRLVVIATHDEVSALQPQRLLPTRVDVPPLRERVHDILLLAHSFAAGTTLSARAARQLEGYSWPGNVAELRGVMQRALVLAGGEPIDLVHLPRQIADLAPAVSNTGIQLPVSGVNLEEVEQHLIRQALAQARGNKSKAAELLGLTRHTLLYRMEKYNIPAQEGG